MNSARILRWLLRLSGGFICLALAAAFLPLPLMARLHEATGLGVLPSGRIVEYLARSACLLYAMHGLMLILASTRVERDPGLVRFVSWMGFGFGAAIVILDIRVGMPPLWTALEGPPVMLNAAFSLWLLGRVQPNRP